SRPLSEAWKPGAQDRRLNFVEPRIHARAFMMIAIGLTAVSQPLDAVGQRAIAGHHCAAISEGTQIFRRIKAERSSDANRADGTPCGRRAVRLTTVLDDGQVMARRDLLDPLH